MNAPKLISPVNDLPYYLRLKLGNETILIGLQQIQTIVPIVSLQKIPSNDEALAGLFNYYGQPVAIYHLSALLEMEKPSYDINALMLLSPFSTQLEGFLVTEDVDIITITEKDIHKPTTLPTKAYMSGLIENEKWSAWILDLAKLLQAHHSTPGKKHD